MAIFFYAADSVSGFKSTPYILLFKPIIRRLVDFKGPNRGFQKQLTA